MPASTIKSTTLLLVAALANLILFLSTPTSAVVNITSQEMYEGIQSGRWDVIIDTRTPAEWDDGHVINATFLDSLQRYQLNGEVATPDDLAGCKDSCTIVIYCRSGNRALIAGEILENAGFARPIYNGLGVNQWLEAGYELVNTPSMVPPCTLTPEGVCHGPIPPTPGPTPLLVDTANMEPTPPDSGGVARNHQHTAFTITPYFMMMLSVAMTTLAGMLI